MGNCWGSRQEPTNPIIYSPPDIRTLQNTPPPIQPNNVLGGRVNPPGGVGVGVGVEIGIGRIIKPNPKIYTFAELKSATRNFKPDSVLGEGGFGRVYKGWIDQTTLAPSRPGVGIPVAVKKCNADGGQGLKEWKTEINFLGKFSHPNLVRLIGYCWEEKELLLVYEYMNNGSLENHLFQRGVNPPSWSTRINIAMGAARGLDFLHTSENTVIYRDFKAANILLDQNFEAKLSDFGLARLGPPVDKSHVTTQAVGTYGYAAPEYINTGHLYVRSDVYGFGVVLLEILTGLKAYDTNRSNGQTSLVDWFKPILSEKYKLKKMIDRRMDEYPSEGVNKLAQLILRCLQNDPKKRPPMSEVLIILERISTIRIPKPVSSKPKRPHSYPTTPAHYQRGEGATSSPRPQTYPRLKPRT
ncbi:probable serine/threonine-protein kinase CST [Amaranthus tricolor]|uniref:probable serine/threonine-protein kinase CST n=1 Tax=Amaranthus tricolor TaxID=29722 RepID=UPI002584AA78|nr:probable serine/threonine-protein kinase CST [Amaranthus tricolor]